MDQIKLLFFWKKYFFTSFCLHLISKLGPDSNTEKNSKHWRQYMQNFLRTPLIREFYSNADSNSNFSDPNKPSLKVQIDIFLKCVVN